MVRNDRWRLCLCTTFYYERKATSNQVSGTSARQVRREGFLYTPLETRLLADARSHGLTVISGVEMFINQAVLQFRHVTGADAPVEVMRRVVMEILGV